LGSGYDAETIVDLDGAYLAPSWIDAHVHIESSMVTPAQFARAVVPRGTTTVVVDPHEIANVHGAQGIDYMLAASADLPLDVQVQIPSCVPATDMGTAGAELPAEALAPFRDRNRVLGLAEVMNYPGVIYGDPGVHAKLRAFSGRPIDGHAPGVRGRALNAYVASGPRTDHECTDPDEATEKLRRGLWVFFREATNARNLDALLPALTDGTAHRICLCTDDRQPADLLDQGGIDAMLRRVVAAGVDPIVALRLATANPAQCHGLTDRGAIAPGRRADLCVLEELGGFRPREVYAAGRRVAVQGRLVTALPDPVPAPAPRVEIDLEPSRLRVPAEGTRLRVIRAVPDQLITGHEVWSPSVREHHAVADPERDLAKLAVAERHGRTGGVGLGFVTGLGLARGALAGTVAHDHHNLIMAGADDVSMVTAARAVAAVGGGLAVAVGHDVLARLPLPVGGLMSEAPIEQVRSEFDALLEAARDLGCSVHDPFMALSFLALEVIPSLKLTDQGLVDVDAFAPVPLWVG
ncbi:MAG: adenine deaminase, partial [Gemmatimonadetes bacterium]|nr:adenine deaminase [Gemmatimonadota bacterium]